MIARGELPSMEHALRHAAHLLQLTPAPLRDAVHLALDEEAFEALLEAGEFDAAARHLLAQPTALSVDQDSHGLVRATISCAILKRAIHGTGETGASAVLAAWTTCLLAFRQDNDSGLLDGSGESRDGPRLGKRTSVH
jgi:hypothetical protein